MLTHVGWGGLASEFRGKEVTGAVLFHCNTAEELKEELGITLPRARVLLDDLSAFRAAGVPRELLGEGCCRCRCSCF